MKQESEFNRILGRKKTDIGKFHKNRRRRRENNQMSPTRISSRECVF